MNPAQLARQECANHTGGGCLFGRPCAVEAGESCAYFESAVLPLADIAGDDRRRAEYAEAAAQYRQRPTQPARPCPSCGLPMKPRRRYCDECRDRAAKDRKRRFWRGKTNGGQNGNQD